jgi:hypothetical protein
MKQLLLVFTFFVSPLLLTAQVSDYNLGQSIPDVPLQVCEGGATGQTVFVNDGGSNGLPTYYRWTSPDGFGLSGFVQGSIPDGQFQFVGILIDVTGFPPGTYFVTIELSYDNMFCCAVESQVFQVNIISPPTASIGTPNGTIICDGNPIVLVGDDGGAPNSDFLWSPSMETTSTISVTTPGTNVLTVTNQCGSDVTEVTVESGTSPSLNSFSCSTVGDVGTITVDANDPDALGLTYQWLENGNPISNGGDFTITDGATTSTLQVDNVLDNHQGSVFTCEVSNFCGDFTTPGCVTLPVELIYFAGNMQEEGAMLKWATASETDSEAFEVERSYDGRTFEVIGEKAAAGNSAAELEYAFLDVDFNPSSEQVYYRLRQIDLDGTVALSHVVAIKTDGGDNFQLESVMAAGQNISVQFFSPETTDYTATIFNLNGQALQSFRFNGYEGFNRQDIQTIDLPAGFYLLQLSDGFRTDVKKFIR